MSEACRLTLLTCVAAPLGFWLVCAYPFDEKLPLSIGGGVCVVAYFAAPWILLAMMVLLRRRDPVSTWNTFILAVISAAVYVPVCLVMRADPSELNNGLWVAVAPILQIGIGLLGRLGLVRTRR